MMSRVSAVILGAGEGKRLQADVPKQFLNLAGIPILARTIEQFQNCNEVHDIVLVTKAGYVDYCRTAIVGAHGFSKVSAIVPGGGERQDSVLAGLSRCSENTGVVLIHDGVRPFVSEQDILNVIRGASEHQCCTLAVPVKDTIKSADDSLNVMETLDRSKLWHIQTPQGFTFDVIRRAYADAADHGVTATDDCMIVERLGYAVRLIPGSYFNIKITTREDLVFAQTIAQQLQNGRVENSEKCERRRRVKCATKAFTCKRQ